MSYSSIDWPGVAKIRPEDDLKPMLTPRSTGQTVGNRILEAELPAFASSPPQRLRFQPPSLDTLAISANRLLKFHFPPGRDLQAAKQLIHKCLHPPKPARPFLDEIPVPLIERLHGQLWRWTLADETGPTEIQQQRSLLLQALITLEDSLQFNQNHWVESDIELLGHHGEGAQLHGHYFSALASPELRSDLLRQLGYDPRWLFASDQLASPSLRYLLCRTLSAPLPWQPLLERLSETNFSDYPYLARLSELADTLFRQPDWPVWAGALSRGDLACLPELLAVLQSFQNHHTSQARHYRPIIRPVELLVLVEGVTEEMLLPAFGLTMGVDFVQLGIRVLPAGGKNQVQSLYQRLREELAAPILILLDRDAKDHGDLLAPGLRLQDRLFVLAQGEFEDTYSPELLAATLTQHYAPHPPIGSESLILLDDNGLGRVDSLRELWRTFQWGVFDKALFAEQMVETLGSQHLQPPETIQVLIRLMLSLRETFRSGRWQNS